MSSEVQSKFRELLAVAGRPAVGALFPSEFEVYMMTLELLDSEKNVADYFSFPVLPDDITKSEPELTNVKKTAGGVVSLTTNTFTPQDITINGTFGRSFKVLIGRDLIDFRAFSSSLKALGKGNINGLSNPFDISIKTGYGCTKLLQYIVDKSTKLDDKGKPYTLFFHNPTLGESYLVEKMMLTLRMDKNTSNRMWGYSLSLKILAPGNVIGELGQSSLINTLSLGVLQKGFNILGSNIGELVRSGATNPLAIVPNQFKKLLNSNGNSL